MCRLVTSGQQIKRFGIIALLFWRHYRHQVAPELQQHNHAVSVLQVKSVFLSPNLVPFLLFSFFFFLKTSFHFVFILCFLSTRAPSRLLSPLSQSTSWSSSHPPPLFHSPFLSCSPDSVHMRLFKRAAVSHTVGNSQPVVFSVVVWFHNTGAEDQI